MASAKTGVALVSDLHAYYGNLENLVKQIAYERFHFYRKNPTGRFVVDMNGDNAGLSPYTYYLRDNGEMIYGLYHVLARNPDVTLIVGKGNHDSYDLEDTTGNQHAYDQSRLLIEVAKPYQGENFRIINANLHLTPAGREIIAPHLDVETEQGKVRFVGFVLDEFFKKSGYRRDAGLQLFTGITPALQLVDDILARAVADGVKVLVPSAHDYLSKVSVLREAFDRANAKLPPEKRVQIPWALAAHDHIQAIDAKRGLLDAGSNGGMVFAVIEDDGTRGEARAYRPDPPGKRRSHVDAPWNTEAFLTAEERRFLNENRPAIERIRAELSAIVGYAPRRFVRKELVKRGAEASGTWMADVLKSWGEERMPERPTNRPRAAFGMWNSSSYRYDYDIEEGEPISNETLLGVYPLAGRPPRRGILFGSTLLALYTSARRERMQLDATHTPQLSSNLREVFVRGQMQLEWFDEASGQWEPIVANDTYLLALDGFLASNGYAISGWDELLAMVQWLDEDQVPSQQELVATRGRRFLRTEAEQRATPKGLPACADEIAGAGGEGDTARSRVLHSVSTAASR